MSKQLDIVSERSLKSISGEFDLESILHLDLSNKGLSSLGSLPQCTQLRVLNLSGNNLTSLKGLATLTALEELDVSTNQIAELDGIEELKCLLKLNLTGNCLSTVDSLLPLTSLPSLTHLSLSRTDHTHSNNLVCNSPSYELFMRDKFPYMVCLDGVQLNGPGAVFYSKCGVIEEERKREIEGRETHSGLQGIVQLCAPLDSSSKEEERERERIEGLLSECSGRSHEISRQIKVLRTGLNSL